MRAILTLFSAFIFSTMVFAAPTKEKVNIKKIKKLAKEIEQTKNLYKENESKKRTILSTLYKISQQKKKISKKKSKITNNLLVTENNVKSLAKKISKLDKEISLYRKRISERLRYLYLFGKAGLVGAVFSSSSIQELDRNLYYLKKMTKKDQFLVLEYRTLLEQAKKKREKINLEVKNLVTLRNRFKKEERKLLVQENKKARIVSQINKHRKTYLNKIKKIKNKAGSFAEKEAWKSLLSTSIFEKKGSLPSPINRPVSTKFGLIRDPEFSFDLAHKGHFYKAEIGVDVFSIFEGKVVFEGELTGYGLCLVIDHGDHYYTVYTNLDDVEVTVGDAVTSGDLIAQAGHTGFFKEPGLYFELRHFSEPEDPKHWLDQNNRIISSLKTSVESI